MLRTIVYYMYYTLLFMFFSIVMVHNVFSDDSFHIGKNMVYLYSVLLLPILYVLFFSHIQEALMYIKKLPSLKQKFRVILCFFVWGVVLFLPFGVAEKMLVCLLLWSCILDIESRASFSLALVMLLYVVFYMIVWDNSMAENFSVYMYYLLVIGIVVEIYQISLSSKLFAWNKS